ncbi:hypothetical protein PL9214510128 [Planktothrix tepida PCC 9214]|uniref:Uncharacterized protein n=1 Tax=Planktothrix tepida PCC 9214 TaxID=671072 RepID=A0A1J1LLW2_9CYAN|nr:hypothetical protein PL9214510128 [Planktothrix tepida PCC 9214]
MAIAAKLIMVIALIEVKIHIKYKTGLHLCNLSIFLIMFM